MKNVQPALTRFEWDGISRTLGNIWTAEKAARKMTCRLVTHPLGWELRLLIGEELFQSETCRTDTKVFEVADRWESEVASKGWVRS